MPSYLIPTSHTNEIEWRNESIQKPPKNAVYTTNSNTAALLTQAHSNIATVWTGDFQQAKHILAAMKKRLRSTKKTPPSTQTLTADAFHRHRMQQAQQSRLLNMLAVEIQANLQLNLPRAPDVSAALLDVYHIPNQHPFLLPLNQLLGFIGAHEWHKAGVYITALGQKIHVPFGVFSPLRGEYLDLLMQAPLPIHCYTAFDIGTGSGVLAALLAQRGIPQIIATDTNPRAIACAQANIQRLGLQHAISLQTTHLFPLGQADLIVCNPPWLPAKPTSTIETALYDTDHTMLKSFLNGVSAHLTPQGEAWLIMSDLAEHLHLRSHEFLPQCFQQAGLQLIDILSIRPTHSKAHDTNNPLAFARQKETTFLYRLQPSTYL